MYGAAVFDMDGTILDTLDDLQLSLNWTLQEHGLAPHTLDSVRRMVGNGVPRLVHLAVPDGTGSECEAQVLADFKRVYGAHCNDHTAPYPGIVSLLQRLKAAGMPLAVVSNKPDFAVRALAQRHFPGVFDAVHGQTDGVPRKPDPTLVFRALDTLGVPAHRACYVGDSEVDIVTARRAHTDAAIVTWGFRDPAYLVEQGASHLMSSMGELENWLLNGSGTPLL